MTTRRGSREEVRESRARAQLRAARPRVVHFRDLNTLPYCPVCGHSGLDLEEHAMTRPRLYTLGVDGVFTAAGRGQRPEPEGHVMGTCQACSHRWRLRAVVSLNDFVPFRDGGEG